VRPSVKTVKALWALSGNRCAICQNELIVSNDGSSATLIGDVCHIIAYSLEGPRGRSSLSAVERASLENLILLCKNDHKLIDSDTTLYSIDHLRDLKRKHELWVRESLMEERLLKQSERLLYLAIVQQWINGVDLANWNHWASHLVSAKPYMFITRWDRLEELRNGLYRIQWPGKLLELERAFKNFCSVLSDLLLIVQLDPDPIQMEAGKFAVSQEFKAKIVSQERYRSGFKRCEEHRELIMDLGLELSRSANYLTKGIIKDLSTDLRDKLPSATVTWLNSALTTLTVTPEYAVDEVRMLYPGLRGFLLVREDRDRGWGRGEVQVLNEFSL
jgi:hypothetical protein